MIDQNSANPEFRLAQPSWSRELPVHIERPFVYYVDDVLVNNAIQHVDSLGLFRKDGTPLGKNGQKSYDEVPPVLSQAANEVPYSGTGFVVQTEEGYHVGRQHRWWKPEHKNDQVFPNYAKKTFPVVPRPIQEERNLVDPTRTPLGTCGFEIEGVVFGKVGQELVPVNVQNIISEIEQTGTVPISLEGWVSQMEYPSRPNTRNHGLYPLESSLVHRQDVIRDLYAIDNVLELLDLHHLPAGVIPFEPEGQPNFDSAHVRNVLIENMTSALGRPVNLEEATERLKGYKTNGLHVTVALQPDSNGLYGSERLHKVANSTHGAILPLLKVFTHSGNLSSPESIMGCYSERENYRLSLPTATVGPMYEYDNTEVHEAVINGDVPSLERAALVNPEGKAGGATHNPLGRQKPGLIEYTIWDVEPNVDKILALESLMSLYTTAVDKAVLDGTLESYKQQMTASEVEYFLALLDDQNKFLNLVAEVDTKGVEGQVPWDGQLVKIGDIVLHFLNWVESFAIEKGIDPEVYEFDYQRLNFLRESLDQEFIADNFDDYLDMSFDTYGKGNVALVARKRWENLVQENPDKDMKDLHSQLLEELSDAYRNHLIQLFEVGS